MAPVVTFDGEMFGILFGDVSLGGTPSKVFLGDLSFVEEILETLFGDVLMSERFVGLAGAFLVGAGPTIPFPLVDLLSLLLLEPVLCISPFEPRNVPALERGFPGFRGLAEDPDAFLGLLEAIDASEKIRVLCGDLKLLFSRLWALIRTGLSSP
jgi:hypothetical protein